MTLPGSSSRSDLLALWRPTMAAVLVLCGSTNPVWAGMPAVGLSDFAALRFQTMSFFAVVFVLSAVAIRFTWNRFARDFESLPQLSLRQAFGVTTVWGLLFVIVLTMISGARELMTPGAWERNGSTYRLRDTAESDNPSDPSVAFDPDAITILGERHQRLAQLREHLDRYATQHEGRFPASLEDLAVSPAHLELPRKEGVRYAYRANLRADGPAVPLVLEPSVYGDDPLVLTTHGAVMSMPIEQLLTLGSSEASP